jgi:hypothetical protein
MTPSEVTARLTIWRRACSRCSSAIFLFAVDCFVRAALIAWKKNDLFAIDQRLVEGAAESGNSGHYGYAFRKPPFAFPQSQDVVRRVSR